MAEFGRVIEETRTRREEAHALLGALRAARAEAERTADGSVPDAFKGVTGESSLERAIERTKRLIASFDRLLDELTDEFGEEDLKLLAEIEAEQLEAERLGSAERAAVAETNP